MKRKQHRSFARSSQNEREREEKKPCAFSSYSIYIIFVYREIHSYQTSVMVSERELLISLDSIVRPTRCRRSNGLSQCQRDYDSGRGMCACIKIMNTHEKILLRMTTWFNMCITSLSLCATQFRGGLCVACFFVSFFLFFFVCSPANKRFSYKHRQRHVYANGNERTP